MNSDATLVEAPAAGSAVEKASGSRSKTYLKAILLNIAFGFAIGLVAGYFLLELRLSPNIMYVLWAAATWAACRLTGLHGLRAHIVVYIASMAVLLAATFVLVILVLQPGLRR